MTPEDSGGTVTIPWALADPEFPFLDTLLETQSRLSVGTSTEFDTRSRLRVHPDDVAAMRRLNRVKDCTSRRWGLSNLDDDGNPTLDAVNDMLRGYGLPVIEPDPSVTVGSAVWVGVRSAN